MKFLLIVFGVVLAAQPSAPGFRLGYARKLYIEELGTDQASKFVRDQLAGALLNRTNLVLVERTPDADAILKGTATVISGYRQWVVGSSSSQAAAAAATSPAGAASAAAVESNAQFSAAGGTVRITELGLQLADRDGRILWAFDATRCRNTTRLVLTGVPKQKPMTVCAVEQLVKAIDRDAKAARSSR